MIELRLIRLFFLPSLTFPFPSSLEIPLNLLPYTVDDGKRWMLLGASRQELAWLQLIGVTEARIRREISSCAQLLIELSFVSGRTGLAQVGQVKLCYNHYFTPERTLFLFTKVWHRLQRFISTDRRLREESVSAVRRLE
jgi:hypothetical protein